MTTPLAQRMLELLYHDAGVRQTAKDALADWILDTQPRTRPLDQTALVDYLARQHPELLARLKRNVRLQAELARPLVAMDPR
jgi:hypothetical protein